MVLTLRMSTDVALMVVSIPLIIDEAEPLAKASLAPAFLGSMSNARYVFEELMKELEELGIEKKTSLLPSPRTENSLPFSALTDTRRDLLAAASLYCVRSTF